MPDTVAAKTRKEAEGFYLTLWLDYEDGPDGFHFGNVTEIKDVTERELYDSDGLVHNEPCMVSYKEMMNHDLKDWDGKPYVFVSLEH